MGSVYRQKGDTVIAASYARRSDEQNGTDAEEIDMRWSHGWLIALIVVVVGGAVAFEGLPRSVQLDALWNTRAAVWGNLLLAANLGVIWWYANLTRQLAESSQALADQGRKQLALTEEQRRREHEPCVVVDWRFLPSMAHSPDGNDYVARNIGRGLALNVICVDDLDATNLRDHVVFVGSLPAGSAERLPQDVIDQCNRYAMKPLERKRQIVIAEPVGGDEWIVSENLVERGGRVSHRVSTKRLAPEQIRQIHRRTLDEYVHENWQAIRAELDQMLKELDPSK